MRNLMSGCGFEDEIALRLYNLGFNNLKRNVFVYSEKLNKYTEIDILLEVNGIICCIEAKSYRTKMEGNMFDNTWLGKSGRYVTRFFNPFLQNEEHANCIRKLLQKTNYNRIVKNIIVTRNSCEVVSDCRNVITVNKLCNILCREKDIQNDSKNILDIILEGIK